VIGGKRSRDHLGTLDGYIGRLIGRGAKEMFLDGDLGLEFDQAICHFSRVLERLIGGMVL
jgi:hypothetical protein